MRDKVYFLSDLHLGAHYLDKKRSERRAVDFLLSIKDDARAVYLLGDVLDYWFEYKTVVPRGYIRFFATLASLADDGVQITWITGNHDVWLRDYLRDEIGMRVSSTHITDTIDGHQFFLSHGDDVGKRPLRYRFMRWCFYNKVCQWLYASIHPRWTYAIAHGWSTQNRTSRTEQREHREVEAGLNNLVAWAEKYSAGNSDIDYFVMGHLHIARQITLGTGKQLVITGDWIKLFTYAVWDGNTLQLKSYNQ